MKILKFYPLFLMLFILIQFFNLCHANESDVSKKNKFLNQSKINSQQTSYLIDINRLKIPLRNDGVMFDISGYGTTPQYDESQVLFSGGFYLVGKNNEQYWANGVATASRVLDYLPGKVGSNPDDSLNIIYVVKSTDTPFGTSWQEYRNAVLLGAEFYDGDGDGIYNPIDKNNNGQWDANEDKPFILGDVTTYCVYNDSQVDTLRRYQGVPPFGIEIHQTAFAVGNPDSPLYNTVFFKYKLINRGLVNNLLDSVYFLFWSDPDLGDYTDDLIGSDSALNSVYCYNNGADAQYGQNPPAISQTMLQGPVVYIPGETFIDNNSNGIYDAGIDIPLDTAIVNLGGLLGVKKYPGAKNQSVKSLFYYLKSTPPILFDPITISDVWNYARGLDRSGNLIDPCTWAFGNVVNYPCNLVNPVYIYNGDPVTQVGWLNTIPADVRMFVSTGPFQLKLNEPVEMWFAIVAGRGQNHLNSISVLKENIFAAMNYYKSNFGSLPTKVEDEEIVLNDFRLYQNYPNPFNPETEIKFTIPDKQFVTLKVYDLLGREIRTLVNETLTEGEYSIKFNAENLTSGVYIYELRSGKNAQAKKMIYLK